MWYHSSNKFFSVTISVVNSTISTNGKGTTYSYALASAYGELMERLQNFAPYHLNTDVSQNAMEYKGFFYAPDEKQMSNKDVLNSNDEWLSSKFSKLDSSINKQKLITKWKNIAHEKIPCDFIALPFCNLVSKNTSYIPIKMLSKMYMSNGMCAGNTPEEALVQGICETLERYVNKRIINEKLCPPTIPKDFINQHIRVKELIDKIESSGNFEVILKDCSLDQGFPVIGIIFIDKDTRSYFIKFGSHPIFEIAVERTLTELLQGQDIRRMKGMWEFSYKSYVVDKQKNLMNILVNGCGEYPIEFFSGKETFKYHKPVDRTQMTNKDMLKFLVTLLNNGGYQVLARDVSFLGFPCYHVIVPELSEIEQIDDIYQLDDYAQFIKMKKMLRKLPNLNNMELAVLARYISKKNLGYQTSVMEFLNIPTSWCSAWYYSNFDLLSIAIYCKLGEYTSSIAKVENILYSLSGNSCEEQMLTYYKCLRDYLCAKADGLEDKMIINTLSDFYPLQMINGIHYEIGEPQNIFHQHPSIQCFNCCNCVLKDECPYIQTEQVYKKLKEKYAENGACNNQLYHILD